MYLVINKWVTAVKVSKFSGHYLRNGSTLDIGVLGYIGIVWPMEHPPEVWSVPPVTPCIYSLIMGLTSLLRSAPNIPNFVLSVFLELWRWILDSSESRSEILGNFPNVMLEKYGEDQLERSCEKWSVTRRRGVNILQTIKRRNADWIGHILRRNCLLIHVVEVSINRSIAAREDDEEDISSYWITWRKR